MRPGRDYLSKIKGRPILYLSEEPIREPTPKPRSVYIENAYNMGKTLEGAGWIVLESEDAMSIRLTDKGVRAGS